MCVCRNNLADAPKTISLLTLLQNLAEVPNANELGYFLYNNSFRTSASHIMSNYLLLNSMSKKFIKFHFFSMTPTQYERAFKFHHEYITVEQHFKSKYRYTIKYPTLPCIMIKGGIKKDGTTHYDYIPIECIYCFKLQICAQLKIYFYSQIKLIFVVFLNYKLKGISTMVTKKIKTKRFCRLKSTISIRFIDGRRQFNKHHSV